MTLFTYAATFAHVAFADKSWNGANCRSHVADGQVPDLTCSLIISWPFLFVQKPIVRAPVLPFTVIGTSPMVKVAEPVLPVWLTSPANV
jgi:hypothetical protein